MKPNDDRLVALELENGSATILGGSTRGSGPSIKLGAFVYDSVADQVVTANFGSNFDSDASLISIDTQTGDRSVVVSPDWSVLNSVAATSLKLT